MSWWTNVQHYLSQADPLGIINDPKPALSDEELIEAYGQQFGIGGTRGEEQGGGFVFGESSGLSEFDSLLGGAPDIGTQPGQTSNITGLGKTWTWLLPLLGIILGAGGAAAQAVTANKNEKRFREDQKKALEQSLAALTPEAIRKLQQELIPAFRANLAAGNINTQASLNAALGRAGLLDSPLGVAISDAAAAAPDLQAFTQSLQAAMGLSSQRSGVLAGFAGQLQPSNKKNVAAAGLSGFAGGLATTPLNFGKKPPPTTPPEKPKPAESSSVIVPMYNFTPTGSQIASAASGGYSDPRYRYPNLYPV